MGWCAGGLLISANGFSRNFVSPSPSRLSAARCARWVIASSRPALAIMPRPPALSRILKKPPHAPGRDRAREGRRSQRDRTLVRRRIAGRAEEQDHPPLGQARLPPQPIHEKRFSPHVKGPLCEEAGPAGSRARGGSAQRACAALRASTRSS